MAINTKILYTALFSFLRERCRLNETLNTVNYIFLCILYPTFYHSNKNTEI